MASLELWAIVDIQREEPRFCYADEKMSKGAMAIYDKKPKIAKGWKQFKEVVKVKIKIIK
jgi:hypothetical protein